MKILYFIAYVYHRLFRFFNRRQGKYQTIKFRDHHDKAKKYKGLLAIIAIVLFLFSHNTTADYLDEEMKTIQVSKSLLESTVIIKTAVQEGSGFYISPNEIITNDHVMGDQTTVFMKKGNGEQCFAELVFKQSDTDLALLKTGCEGKPISLADSVKVGQTILTMGNPMYNEFYVSKGVVGLHDDGKIIHNAITDLGSSGGPVVNMDGQLVGVSQAISKSTRLSFAIDIKTLSYFMYQSKGE